MTSKLLEASKVPCVGRVKNCRGTLTNGVNKSVFIKVTSHDFYTKTTGSWALHTDRCDQWEICNKDWKEKLTKKIELENLLNLLMKEKSDNPFTKRYITAVWILRTLGLPSELSKMILILVFFEDVEIFFMKTNNNSKKVTK